MVAAIAGLVFDGRFINGERAWIKPLKFSISFSVYGYTLIYFSQFLTKNRGFFQRISQAALLGTTVELSAIILQVLRGTTSHFNTSSPFDHTIFLITVLAIMPVSFGIVAMFVMLLAEEKLPPVLGLALRWALFLTIIGLIPGLLMILPAKILGIALHQMHTNGHTIGYPEGGPGLPWLGWSTVAGDLRVAHFVGIHSLQILPIVGFVISKLFSRLPIVRQQTLVINAGMTYLGWIFLLTWQALMAEPLVAPSHNTLLLGYTIVAASLSAAALTCLLPEVKTSKSWPYVLLAKSGQA
jgi:hypothetical protein